MVTSTLLWLLIIYIESAVQTVSEIDAMKQVHWNCIYSLGFFSIAETQF